MTPELIMSKMQEQELKAWKSLAGYKFWMFGYHAANWINLNRLLPQAQPNPFKNLVLAARLKIEARKGGAQQ